MGLSDYGMAWWMWLVMLSSLTGLWTLVVVLVRNITRGPADGTTPDEPLTALDRRLAAGEVSVEEYHRLRRTIVDGH